MKHLPVTTLLTWGFLLVTVYSGTAKADSAGTPWTVAKPMRAHGISKIETSGRGLPYYLLRAGRPLEVKVAGPARLRALTRRTFDARAENEESYEFQVIIDSTDRRTYRKKTRRSFLSSFVKRSDSVPGKIRNAYLYVPDGTHTYRFQISPESKQTVLMRFLVRSTDSEREWAYLSPKTFPSMEILEVNGKERTYFPVTSEESATVEAAGQSQLKILTRWQSFEPAFKEGEFQLQVFQDGVLHSTKLMTSGRTSEKVFSAERLSVIGNSRFFIIDVPDGSHRYTFRLAGSPDIAAILIRPFLRVGGAP